jgi:hypothetical protein
MKEKLFTAMPYNIASPPIKLTILTIRQFPTAVQQNHMTRFVSGARHFTVQQDDVSVDGIPFLVDVQIVVGNVVQANVNETESFVPEHTLAPHLDH